jgi:hypothetical protein
MENVELDEIYQLVCFSSRGANPYMKKILSEVDCGIRYIDILSAVVAHIAGLVIFR